MNKIDLGKVGEDVVCNYIEKAHYNIIERNFKCKYGEIDIIAVDRNELVFIEVKTRCSKKYGEARDSVNQHKKKHIKKATEFYIKKYKLEGKFIRFDIIEAYLKNDIFYVNHLKNTLW